MGDVKPGYVSRPDYSYDNLLETVGYVRTIWVEQEGNYDQVKFLLDVYYLEPGDREPAAPLQFGFSIYLDRNTTAAFAMFQLLRDALASMQTKAHWLVNVHFTFTKEMDAGYAYYVKVHADRTGEFPVTVQGYYDTPVTGWWTHLE